MIHCMQLWLLGYCISQQRRQSPRPRLEDIVQEQCRLHLVNTTPGPMAELSFWRLLTKAARNDTTHPPVTTITDDCMQVNHADITLRVPAWRQALQVLIGEATEILNTDLLFDLRGLIDRPVSSLQDNMAELSPGRCFLDDPRNRLHAVRDHMVEQLLQTPTLRVQFLKEPSPSVDSEEPPGERLAVKELETARYFQSNQRFLQLLAVLIIMTAGLPARRKELLGISWCNQESPRNIYVYDGLLAVITSYHKSQWRVGNRPVARFLPPCLGDLLVRYLIYVPPVLQFFSYCMQSQYPRGFLFSTGNGVWSPDQVSAAMKLHTNRVLGVGIRHRQWRHIAIALDRRFFQGVAARVYNLSSDLQGQQEGTSDSDLDPIYRDASSRSLPSYARTAGSAHHWQAAHTMETNISHYGNTALPFNQLTDSLLAEFCSVSRQFHQLAHLQAPQTSCGRKRPGSGSSILPMLSKKPLLGSRRHFRQQLWTWTAIEKSLKDLFGPDATARDRMQRDALRLLAGNVPESVIVMPTAGGKSTLYLILSRLPSAEVTVVVVPYIALRQDLIRRCRDHRIPYWRYDQTDRMQDRLHTVPSLVLVDVETAVTSGFLALARQLNDLGRLDRLILDEAHLILTAAYYREHLGLLGVLRRIACSFTCLTATLPPHGELDLQQSLFLSRPVIQRASSDRPNLEYCVQSLPAITTSSAPPSPEARLASAVVQLHQEDLRQWRASGDPGLAARSICYVRQRTTGVWLAKQLDCDFYHAKLSKAERESIITAWSSGQRCPILVATSALVGVDYPSVRRIIHVDAPEGLVAYAQDTGRAGRDGLHAVCTVILPPKWSVSWGNEYQNDFLVHDRAQMARFLQTRHCLRKLLTGYLDGPLHGRDGTACSDAGRTDLVPCMNCQQTVTTPRIEESSCNRDPPDHAAEPATPGPTNSEMEDPGDSEEDPGDSEIDNTVDSNDSCDDASSACSTGRPPSPTISATDAWDAAALLARAELMDQADAQTWYEDRLAVWGRACILCSFHRRQRLPFPHPDCMQGQFAESIGSFRRAIRFDSGIGCFRCGQPSFICQQRGQAGCRYPWFVFHCCWVAATQGSSDALDLLCLLGGPDLSTSFTPHAGQLPADYLRWLGRKRQVFGRFPAANAMYLASFWIDHLEQLVSVDSMQTFLPTRVSRP